MGSDRKWNLKVRTIWNGSSDKNYEYDEEATLSAASRKTKELGWEDAGPLRKLHAIATYMRSSKLLYNESLGAVGRMIPMGNDTRWNSWHTMNTVACELEGYVDTFVKNHWKAIEKHALTPDHWDTVREITISLSPLRKLRRELNPTLILLRKPR